MKTFKMNLANIQGKITRSELRKIMAGSGGGMSNCSVQCPGGATWPRDCGYGVDCTSNNGPTKYEICCGSGNTDCREYCIS